MGFTTHCFIRKNTPELRKKLEELGYKYSTFDDLELDGIITFPNKNKYSIWANYHFDMKYVLKSNIDCGTNEELFLSLAALRDDTDRNQWFVDDNTGIWERSDDDFPSRYMQMEGHKATVEEIIEHFTVEK